MIVSSSFVVAGSRNSARKATLSRLDMQAAGQAVGFAQAAPIIQAA
jgi:hypothetical protein